MSPPNLTSIKLASTTLVIDHECPRLRVAESASRSPLAAPGLWSWQPGSQDFCLGSAAERRSLRVRRSTRWRSWLKWLGVLPRTDANFC